jgi:dTDP-4-amino-4,6-dideoxygalactose transaminase
LYETASAAGIVVVLDAAHAIGARAKGEPIGRYADMTMLSFHPAKHVATGEGGAILTDNKAYYDKLVLFRSHGITKDPDALGDSSACAWYYEMRELGFNYRLTDIQCALGISQLKKLGASLARRQEIADRYKRELNLDWLTLPPEPESHGHAWHLYPVLVKAERRRFFDYLRGNGILAQVHYIPVHYMPYYKEKNWFKPGDFPNAEEFYEREVSLPMFPELTESEQGHVIDVIRRYDA